MVEHSYKILLRTSFRFSAYERMEKNIRSLEDTTPVQASNPIWNKMYRRFMRRIPRRSQKRFVRYSVLLANVALLIIVVAFVVGSSSSSSAVHQSVNAEASPDIAANPLDQVSSADIAVQVARMTNLYEKVSVTNNADSVNAQLATPPSATAIATKPQVITTALKSIKDLQRYTVQPGDTVASLTTKFGVTSDTIMWSNNLTGNALTAGTQLYIPPVNGIVYTAQAGDTADSLAAKFHGNKDAVIAFNDTEVSGIKAGQVVVIPDGNKTVAVAVRSTGTSYLGAFAWGGYSPIYGANAYDFGWCTWYVASKIAVPSNWGNANTWAIYAARSGWTVSSVPRAGAIAQTSAGWAGHVGIVEAVSPDGTMMKYSDMNGLAGWGRVGYSDWVPIHGHFQNFIYH